jgi:hypothetical protein
VISFKSVGLTLGDAIAAVSVLASLLLFVYSRAPNRDPRRILDWDWCTWFSQRSRLG